MKKNKTSISHKPAMHHALKRAIALLLTGTLLFVLCSMCGFKLSDKIPKMLFTSKVVAAIASLESGINLDSTLKLVEKENSEEASISDYIFDQNNDAIDLKVVQEQEPELKGSNASEYLLVNGESKTPENSLPINAITVIGNTKNYLNYKGIYVKNPTTASIDIKAMYEAKLSWSLSSKGPDILIIHTHGSESFSPYGATYYMPTDSSRSTDINNNVVRVGSELAKVLEDKGYGVIHSTAMYDQPTYIYSYSHALQSISAYLKKYPSIKMVIDIHRDAMVSASGTKYKIVSKVNGEDCAQLMLVMGTGISGLSFPNWRENLKFALRLQKSIVDKYPTLARPITITKNRYNEHTTKASMIIEIGTDGNSLQEAIRTADLLGGCLADVLKPLKS